MPWARIPCNKLDSIGLFGYSLEHEDGKILWYRGPQGKMYAVDRHAPRFFFDSVTEAMQAGCTAVRIATPEDMDDYTAHTVDRCNADEADGAS